MNPPPISNLLTGNEKAETRGNAKTKSMSWLAAVAGLLLAQAAAASAAEIKVYSTIGIKSVLEDLIPKFEKQPATN